MSEDSKPEIDDERHRWLLEQYTEIASLAGGLAHEIRNPLSTLSLNLQLLAEDFQTPQSQVERRALQKIETLQRECRRLEEILSDFLKFARVSELTLQPADINALLQEMIDFHAPKAQAMQVLIRHDLPPSIPPVMLDNDLFKQAFLNLFLNALQAMPDGGEMIVRSRSDGKNVFINVIDTGPGMSKETMAKIFKPFFSTRPSGSGLGLPTTKKIIEAHQGKLLVDSEAGKGTAFTIVLPIPVGKASLPS